MSAQIKSQCKQQAEEMGWSWNTLCACINVIFGLETSHSCSLLMWNRASELSIVWNVFFIIIIFKTLFLDNIFYFWCAKKKEKVKLSHFVDLLFSLSIGCLQ